MSSRLEKYFEDDKANAYQDVMAKRKDVDARMEFAVNLGTILVRTLDKMSRSPEAVESKFEIGSGESAFEIIVRKKQ